MHAWVIKLHFNDWSLYCDAKDPYIRCIATISKVTKIVQDIECLKSVVLLVLVDTFFYHVYIYGVCYLQPIKLYNVQWLFVN